VVTDNFVRGALTHQPGHPFSQSQVYLYGGTPGRKLAVARAARTGFLGSLEDHGLYEYYVNGGEFRIITNYKSTESDRIFYY
jgi:hypothetical protein